MTMFLNIATSLNIRFLTRHFEHTGWRENRIIESPVSKGLIFDDNVCSTTNQAVNRRVVSSSLTCGAN